VARIAHVTLVDDIDGSPASETVFFSLGGRHYDIDLSAENAAKLRAGLASFVAAARRDTAASSEVVYEFRAGERRGVVT